MSKNRYTSLKAITIHVNNAIIFDHRDNMVSPYIVIGGDRVNKLGST